MSFEATLASVYKAHAAELERLKADYTRELNAKLEQINKQAETINQLTKDYHVKHLNYEKLEQELLSALAAIDKHIESYHQGYNDACTMIYENPTEAQEKHDAEVRKPLVDALEESRQDLLSYMSGVGYSSNIVNKIDDALAKIQK